MVDRTGLLYQSLEMLRKTTKTESRQDNVTISVGTNVFGSISSCLHVLGNVMPVPDSKSCSHCPIRLQCYNSFLGSKFHSKLPAFRITWPYTWCVSTYCSTAVLRSSGLDGRRGGKNNGGSPLPGVHRTSFLVSSPNPEMGHHSRQTNRDTKNKTSTLGRNITLRRIRVTIVAMEKQ